MLFVNELCAPVDPPTNSNHSKKGPALPCFCHLLGVKPCATFCLRGETVHNQEGEAEWGYFPMVSFALTHSETRAWPPPITHCALFCSRLPHIWRHQAAVFHRGRGGGAILLWSDQPVRHVLARHHPPGTLQLAPPRNAQPNGSIAAEWHGMAPKGPGGLSGRSPHCLELWDGDPTQTSFTKSSG